MRTQDFDYTLPEELIAQQPLAQRSASRMLHLGPEGNADLGVRDLPELLQPEDLLVFNNTRVIPARLHGNKRDSGGRVELMLERIRDHGSAVAMLRASKTPPPGTVIDIGDYAVEVQGREGMFFVLGLKQGEWQELLAAHGEIPLPPYITRKPEDADQERYQSLLAEREGAVAAPTASLHFDEDLLGAIQARGVERGITTLHIGAGTFQPVRVEDVKAHQMHKEWYEVSTELVAQIQATKNRGGRVVAVGTTVVRSLESAARSGTLRAGHGDTDLFITPGFKFHVVDALLTNFHLPQSTLMMLVSAMAGRERILSAYAHAVEQRYRFFSYGDAMFISQRLA